MAIAAIRNKKAVCQARTALCDMDASTEGRHRSLASTADGEAVDHTVVRDGDRAVAAGSADRRGRSAAARYEHHFTRADHQILVVDPRVDPNDLIILRALRNVVDGALNRGIR